jgi:protoporphyrinogen oxidase
MAPEGQSGLCVEFTCREGDERWQHPERYTEAVIADLVRTKTIDRAEQVRQVHIERVPFTYPIYKINYLGELTRNLKALGRFSHLLLADRDFWSETAGRTATGASQIGSAIMLLPVLLGA